jgi:hypothetical protein
VALLFYKLRVPGVERVPLREFDVQPEFGTLRLVTFGFCSEADIMLSSQSQKGRAQK